jgi:hypothetical protein
MPGNRIDGRELHMERTASTGGIARTYALIFGITYIVVALLLGGDGLVIGDTTILQLTGLQNAVHWLIGIVVLASYASGEAGAKATARVIGVVFLLLTLAGFMARETVGDLLGFDGPLPWSYNIVHALSAVAALFAGFAATKAYGNRTTTRV